MFQWAQEIETGLEQHCVRTLHQDIKSYHIEHRWHVTIISLEVGDKASCQLEFA